MKRLSKVLALLLVVAMMASLICVPALADGEKDPYASLKQGTGYVAVGDSFARGYGASDHWESQLYNNQYYGRQDARNVDGSYPNLVAEHFELYAPNDIYDTDAKFWSLAHDAVSTAFILDLLGIDDGFRDDAFTYQDYAMRTRYSTDLAYYGCPESYTLDGVKGYDKEAEIMNVRELFNNASLITLGLGQTDVIYRAIQLGFLGVDFSDMEALPGAIANLVKILYENFEYWKNAYPLLLDYIKENNPDAKVVLVGTMNPLQNAMLSNEIFLPLGSAVNFLLDNINIVTKELAAKYGYMFVDISNVDVFATTEDVSIFDMLSLDLGGDEWAIKTHPTPDGYAQIARMIIDKVETELAKEAAAEEEVPYIPADPYTYIKVDMGRFETIDYVMVDGDRITDYSVNDHVLTIPWLTTTADTLTVAVKNELGKITLISYTLKYDYQNGTYVAHRIYETNDVGNVVVKTVQVIKTVVTKVVSFVKGIFGL